VRVSVQGLSLLKTPSGPLGGRPTVSSFPGVAERSPRPGQPITQPLTVTCSAPRENAYSEVTLSVFPRHVVLHHRREEERRRTIRAQFSSRFGTSPGAACRPRQFHPNAEKTIGLSGPIEGVQERRAQNVGPGLERPRSRSGTRNLI